MFGGVGGRGIVVLGLTVMLVTVAQSAMAREGGLRRLLATEEPGYGPARVALARTVAGWFFAIREVVAPRPERLTAPEADEGINPQPLERWIARHLPAATPADTAPSHPQAAARRMPKPLARPRTRGVTVANTPLRHTPRPVETPTMIARPEDDATLPRQLRLGLGGRTLERATVDHPALAVGMSSAEEGEASSPLTAVAAALAHGRIETGSDDWKLAVSVSRDLDTFRLGIKHRFSLDW